MTRKIYEKSIYTTRPNQLDRKVYKRANNVIPVYGDTYSITSMTLVAGGTGYTADETITIKGDLSETPAILTVKTVSEEGEILTFEFTAGSYESDISGEIELAGETGTGAKFTVVAERPISEETEEQ